MPERRNLAGRMIVVLAAVLVIGATVTGYVRYELLDGSRFTDRAVQTLHDNDVRELLGRELTDRVVLRADPDLLAARPLIESLTAGIVGTSPFVSLYGSAVRRAHDSLLSGHSSRLQLDLRDAGVLVRSAMSRLRPSLAGELPAGDLQLRPAPDAVQRVATTARDLRRLSWLLLALAAIAIAAGLAIVPDRRGGLRLLGIATAVVAIAGVVALRIGRSALAAGVGDDATSRRALEAAYGAFLGDLSTLLLVVGAAGAITAAVASTRGELPALAPFLERAWAFAGATPRSGRLRLGRALLVLAAGIGTLADPGAAVKLVASAVGLVLVYVGTAELVRLLQAQLGAAPPPGEAMPRGLALRRALPAVAVALLALVAIGLFARSGGVSPPPAHASGLCNGRAELCDRTLDDVVLPATHNAMSAADQPGWFSAEQETSIPRQLDAGVRGLLIDVHYGIKVSDGVRTDLSRSAERAGDKDRELYLKKLGPAGFAAIQRIRDRAIPGEGTSRPFLCHRFCELGATRFDTTLTAIRDFLLLHPGEVLVIVIEDYVTPADVVAAFKSTGLDQLVYTGPAAGPFPTLREMIDSNQRVVVYAENNGGAAPWYTQAYKGALQETPFDFGTIKKLTAPSELAASCRPNRGTATAPLMLMNHWVATAPLSRPSNGRAVNVRSAIVDRARECTRIRGQMPNLIAVDFYRQGDVFGAVDELNGL
ncbi:MAG TPA: hypothetical protein VFB41_10695 [Solirubrobacteraceae bacterium]|nr:hypothetical protein [Solirubrobacteraceae bacterium]